MSDLVAPPPAIECHHLTRCFGAVRAVDGVDLTVPPGELFGLLGPNGAGKTTTIRILTTLIHADSGSACVFGVDVRREPMRVRRMLGYVPQQLSADGSLTGYENVWLYARLFDVPRREREGRIREVLGWMGLADAVCGRRRGPHALVPRLPDHVRIDEHVIDLGAAREPGEGQRYLGSAA